MASGLTEQDNLEPSYVAVDYSREHVTMLCFSEEFLDTTHFILSSLKNRSLAFY